MATPEMSSPPTTNVHEELAQWRMVDCVAEAVMRESESTGSAPTLTYVVGELRKPDGACTVSIYLEAERAGIAFVEDPFGSLWLSSWSSPGGAWNGFAESPIPILLPN